VFSVVPVVLGSKSFSFSHIRFAAGVSSCVWVSFCVYCGCVVLGFVLGYVFCSQRAFFVSLCVLCRSGVVSSNSLWIWFSVLRYGFFFLFLNIFCIVLMGGCVVGFL
jgi:hypothetical protein